MNLLKADRWRDENLSAWCSLNNASIELYLVLGRWNARVTWRVLHYYDDTRGECATEWELERTHDEATCALELALDAAAELARDQRAILMRAVDLPKGAKSI